MTAGTDADETADGFQFATEAVAGTMYCVGHNQNFGNHRSTAPDFVTGPATPRLRIGLAHAANETDDQRKDVDFDACRIRIVDADGDALPEADDAATVPSGYGARDGDHDDHDDTPALKGPNKLFLYDLLQAPTFNPGPAPTKGTLGTGGHALVNVRGNDGGGITEPMKPGGWPTNGKARREPGNLPPAMVKVGLGSGTAIAVGAMFAEPPDARPTTSSPPPAPASSRPHGDGPARDRPNKRKRKSRLRASDGPRSANRTGRAGNRPRTVLNPWPRD